MRRRLFASGMLMVALLPTGGCWTHIHSKRQEMVATDVRDRYKTVQPAGARVLATFDQDLELLIDAQRRNYETIRGTFINAALTNDWDWLASEVDDTATRFETIEAEADEAIVKVKANLANLAEQKKGLDKAVDDLDKAVKTAAQETRLADKIKNAREQVDAAVAALSAAAGAEGANPTFKERLEAAVKLIDEYLDSKPNDEADKVAASLAVEAVKLGRDIAVQEREALLQEIKSKKRILDYHETKKRYLLPPANIRSMKSVFPTDPAQLSEKIYRTIENMAAAALADRSARAAAVVASSTENAAVERGRAAQIAAAAAHHSKPGSPEDVRARVAEQAAERANEEAARAAAALELAKAIQAQHGTSPAAERLAQILRVMGHLASLEVASSQRLRELDLRIKAEEYRNARFKDAIYERQRMTLISYGLEGVVRYAESGLRAEDIANMINAARAVAEFIIAARVGE
jgi:hypothetical protein